MWRLGVFSWAANGWEKHPRIFLVSSVPSILHRHVYAGPERYGVGGVMTGMGWHRGLFTGMSKAASHTD